MSNSVLRVKPLNEKLLDRPPTQFGFGSPMIWLSEAKSVRPFWVSSNLPWGRPFSSTLSRLNTLPKITPYGCPAMRRVLGVVKPPSVIWGTPTASSTTVLRTREKLNELE